MPELGKLLIVLGIAIEGVGVLLWCGFGNWIGRLPGDIRVECGHSGFYFPVVSCIIISIVLSLLFALSPLMARIAGQQARLSKHVARLRQCRGCPRVIPPPVSGGAVVSEVVLIGQAPGVREPLLKRPFAHTAGRTLFRWFEEWCELNEATMRSRIYFAAVIRCFPGKASGGTDRVPAPQEIANCSSWMNDELEILRPRLVIPVGRLAIAQFIVFDKLDAVIGRKFVIERDAFTFDLIPLPHPSGASPWHKISPGRELLGKAMRMIARHPAIRVLTQRPQR